MKPRFSRGQVVAQPMYSSSGGCYGYHHTMVLDVRKNDPWDYRLENPLEPRERWVAEKDLEIPEIETYLTRKKIQNHLRKKGIDFSLPVTDYHSVEDVPPVNSVFPEGKAK